MKFGVLALDYDGTIAHDGILDSNRLGYVESLRGELVKAIRERSEIESELVL